MSYNRTNFLFVKGQVKWLIEWVILDDHHGAHREHGDFPLFLSPELGGE